MRENTTRITVNPDITLGQPVIRHTRLTVALIVRKLAEGAQIADLLAMYQQLEAEDIQAAIAAAGSE